MAEVIDGRYPQSVIGPRIAQTLVLPRHRRVTRLDGREHTPLKRTSA